MRLLLVLFLAQTLRAQCNSGTERPRPVRTPTVSYPESAYRWHLQGQIKLDLLISPDGSPGKVSVVNGFGYGLDEAAVRAVSGWRFSSDCGERTTTVVLNFDLGAPKYERFRMGPMLFESSTDLQNPILKSLVEPDLSGSLAGASDGEIEFTVTTEGDPINFREVKAVEAVAERNILRAFARWKFEPAQKDGLPTDARGRFRFHINP